MTIEQTPHGWLVLDGERVVLDTPWLSIALLVQMRGGV